MKKNIRYRVAGYEGTATAGPYEEGPELELHKMDIASYEGVTIVGVEDELQKVELLNPRQSLSADRTEKRYALCEIDD